MLERVSCVLCISIVALMVWAHVGVPLPTVSFVAPLSLAQVDAVTRRFVALGELSFSAGHRSKRMDVQESNEATRKFQNTSGKL